MDISISILLIGQTSCYISAYQISKQLKFNIVEKQWELRQKLFWVLCQVSGQIFVNIQKLYRCVVESKLKGKFGDGCVPSEDAESGGVTSWEGALAPSFTPLVHIYLKSCIAVSRLE